MLSVRVEEQLAQASLQKLLSNDYRSHASRLLNQTITSATISEYDDCLLEKVIYKPSVCQQNRPVAQLAERRSPKPKVGGSMPSWPAKIRIVDKILIIFIMTSTKKILS